MRDAQECQTVPNLTQQHSSVSKVLLTLLRLELENMKECSD